MVSYTSSEEMSQQYDLNAQHKSSRITKKAATMKANNAQKPKVYKVEPIHFRKLVQELTGSQQPNLPRRSALQSVAPPPLPINQKQTYFQNHDQTRLPEKPVDLKSSDTRVEWDNTSEFNLSPNFQAWFNFAMLSPEPAPVSH